MHSSMTGFTVDSGPHHDPEVASVHLVEKLRLLYLKSRRSVDRSNGSLQPMPKPG